MTIRPSYQTSLLVGIAFNALVVISGCGVAGVTCGDLAALLCGEGLYCKYEDGSCGEDGEFGLCALRPEVCAANFAPVCGCDGRTYGNECNAAGNGVSIESAGECP